jgi:tetratricopeptide (TPR) repeat protein
VIHRDIKPTNVLVGEYDNRAVPRIIDFGVAKATQQQLTEKTVFTQFGQIVGTVDYMSPEQAKLNELDVDTRSDIYSLGVLLYELLAGETPFDRQRLRSAAFDELLRIIREEEPPKPSLRLSTSEALPSIAANRQMEPRKLSTLVRGELDWIVMKALEKDRTRRYETAASFSADIERYLSDEPVQACPPSAVYRWHKWVRRHKAAAAVASAVVIGLIVGTAGLTIGLFQARQKQQVAEQQKQRAVEGEKKEKEARRRLQQTTSELDEANRRLAVEGARLALEKGNALVKAGDSQEGLLWLARALEQTPAGEESLEDKIRIQFSSVAATLPVPQWIFTPAANERFDHIRVNLARDRLLAAVSGAREEIRVWSLLTGKSIATIPQDGPVAWCDFSANGKMLYAVTRGKLQQYDASSQAAIGNPVELPPDSQILAIRPNRKQALVEDESDAGGESGATYQLFDLATGETQMLASGQEYVPRYTPDGKWVILKETSGDLRVSLKRSHVEDGTIDDEWSIDDVAPRARIDFSPDGLKLVVTSRQLPIEGEPRELLGGSRGSSIFKQVVRFFDLETAKPEQALVETDGPWATAALSSDGNHLLTLGWTPGTGQFLSVWHGRTGQQVFGPLPLISGRSRLGLATRVTFVAGEDSFLTINPQRAVQWRLPTLPSEKEDRESQGTALRGGRPGGFAGQPITTGVMLGDGRTVTGVAMNSGTRGRTDSMRLFQARRWDLVQEFQPTGRALAVLDAEHATISPDGSTFVTAAKGRIHRWRLPTGEAIGKPIRLEQSNVVRLQVSRNGKVLMCQTERTRSDWRRVNRPLSYYWIGASIRSGVGGVEVFTVHPNTPAPRAGLNKGDVLLYAADLPVLTMTGFINQIAAAGESPIPLVVRRGDQRLNLAITPTVKPDNILRSESSKFGNGRLTFYSMDTGDRLDSLAVPIQGLVSGGRDALGASISPDGSTVATISRYDLQHLTLQLWDMKTGRPRGAAAQGLGEGGQVAFSPDGATLATIGLQQVELWNTTPPFRQVARIRHPGGVIRAVAFNGDGLKLATVGGMPGQQSICLWDVATARQLGLAIPVSGAGPNAQLIWHLTGERMLLLRQKGVLSLDLPKPWEGNKSVAMHTAVAMVGCRLDPQLGTNLLESADWQRRLAESEVGEEAIQETPLANGEVPAWQTSLEAVRSAAGSGDLTAAELSLKQVVSIAPREAILGWLEDMVCLIAHRPRSQDLLQWYCLQLLKQDPANYLAHQMQVVPLMVEGKFDEAEESFRRAIENGPRDLLLEQFYMQVRKMVDRRRVPQISGVGEAVQPLGSSDDGKEWLLDQILRFKPTHTRSRLLRMVLRIRTERLAAAEQDLALLSKEMADTDGAEDLRLSARQLLGRYDVASVRAATMIFRKLTESVPDNWHYWYELGHAHGRIRQWSEAERALRKVIELDPGHSFAHLQVAAILAGRADQAAYRQFCKGAREQLKSGDSLAQFRSYEAALWAPNTVSDPNQLVDGIRRQSGIGRSWHECAVGIAHHRAGHPQDAIEWLEKVIEDVSNHSLVIARAHVGLALVHHQLGDSEEAQRQVEEARRQKADHLEQRSDEDLGNHWISIRILEVLDAEAEGLLKQQQKKKKTTTNDVGEKTDGPF